MKYPKTPAIRLLEAKKIDFDAHLYPFEEHGGTSHAAACLKVSEHAVIKTLVMEDDAHQPFLVLMHGNCEVSLKQLARILNVKRVSPCDITSAQKHTGYLVGGISPFGTRTPLSVYAESTVFSLGEIYINGGKRGFLVGIDPQDLYKAFSVKKINVAIQYT